MVIYIRGRTFALVFVLSVVVLTASVLNHATPLVQSVATLLTNRLVPIYKVSTAERKISISFDATWGVDLTDEILDILDDNGVKTTFFLAGNWVEEYPDYVKKIVSRGHEIGNHSYAHPHFNQLSKDQIRADLKRQEALITKLTQKRPILFRPPFGEYSNKLIEVTDELGYYTIQWSIDSLDWKNVSADFMVQRVMSNLAPGEIILFHNAGKNTPAAVRRLLPQLAAAGYRVVPISQLIYKNDYYIESHSGLQRSLKLVPPRDGPAAPNR